VSARLRSGYGAWEALTSAFAECDRVGKPLCPQAGHIGTEWNRLTAKLRQGPVHAGRQRITYADVIGNILGGLYDARYYPDILRFIHQVYRQVFTSQPNAAQAAGEAWADLQRDAAASGGSPPRYGSVIGRAPAVQPARDRLSPQFQGVLCSDSVNPRHESAAVPSAHFASHQGPGFGALWSWLSSVCVDWPGSSADAFRGPWRTVTSNPLLITGNVHDPATPISGARAANKLFEGSRLITVNTWGHGALGHSRCATAKWDRYWVSGRLPASGLVCRPNAHLFHH
jgi:hypothetical protein